jgi:hypothetical protein
VLVVDENFRYLITALDTCMALRLFAQSPVLTEFRRPLAVQAASTANLTVTDLTGVCWITPFSWIPVQVLAMDHNQPLQDVLRTVQTTLFQYRIAATRYFLDAPALSILRSLESPLERLEDLLTLIDGNERMDYILSGITLSALPGTVPTLLLDSLTTDLRTLRTYLDKIRPDGVPLGRLDIQVHVRALERYVGIVKLVLKSNTMYGSASLVRIDSNAIGF